MKIFDINKLIILFLVLGLSLFLFSSNADAATLEVGSGKTYSTIQAAVNAALPGDTVMVYAGTYREQVTTTRAGSAGNYITIKAAEPGVIVDGEGIRDGFLLNRHNYIIIDGFNIINAYRSSAYGGAINCQRSQYAIIRNNVITNSTGGTGGGSNPQTGVGDFNIESCSNLLLENNRALSRDADYNLGTWWSANMVIRGNEFSGAIRYPVKLSALANNLLFEKNYVHTDKPVGTNNGEHFNLFFRDSENGTVRYNIFDARGSDALSAMELYDYTCDNTENHNIYNNVIIHNRGGRPGVRWTCQEGTYFRNNIVVSSSTAQSFISVSSNNISIDYNIHSAPVEYSNSNGSGFTDGPYNINSDPQFLAVGNVPSPYFQFQPTSPAINAGYPNTTPGTDYAGTTTPQGAGFDIGAFEYVSGEPPDTTPPSPPNSLRVQ